MEAEARAITPEERLGLRQLHWRPILDQLHDYLLEVRGKVMPKSPEGRAVRYTLKNWRALTRYSEDGDLEIDNNRYRARHPWCSDRPEQLGVLWKRSGRKDRRGVAELRGYLSARGSRSLRLVQRRPLAHCRSSHQPSCRTPATQLGARPSLSPNRKPARISRALSAAPPVILVSFRCVSREGVANFIEIRCLFV